MAMAMGTVPKSSSNPTQRVKDNTKKKHVAENQLSSEPRLGSIEKSESLPSLTNKLRVKIGEIHNINSASSSRLAKMERDLNEARETVESLKHTNREERLTIESQELTIHELQYQNNNLESKIEELKRDQENTEEEMSKTVCETCPDLKKELQLLELKYSDKKTRSELEKGLEEIKSELSLIERERDALAVTDKIRQKHYEELMEKYRKLSALHDEIASLLEEEREENSILDERYRDQREKNYSIEKQLEMVQEKCKKKEIEIEKLNDTLKQSQRNHELLEDSYTKIQNDLKDADSEIRGQQDKLAKCYGDLKKASLQIGRLKEDRGKLLAKLESRRSDEEELQKVVKALNKNVGELAAERQYMYQKMRSMGEDLAIREKAFKDIKKSLRRKSNLMEVITNVANGYPTTPPDEGTYSDRDGSPPSPNQLPEEVSPVSYSTGNGQVHHNETIPLRSLYPPQAFIYPDPEYGFNGNRAVQKPVASDRSDGTGSPEDQVDGTINDLDLLTPRNSCNVTGDSDSLLTSVSSLSLADEDLSARLASNNIQDQEDLQSVVTSNQVHVMDLDQLGQNRHGDRDPAGPDHLGVDLSSDRVDAEGFLMRKHDLETSLLKAQKRSWKSVYVVQSGQSLTFFKSREDHQGDAPLLEPGNPINLRHAQVFMEPDCKKKHTFKLRLPQGGQYVFQAVDDIEMIKWVCSIDAVTHDPEQATAPFGATYPLPVLERCYQYEEHHSGIVSPGPSTARYSPSSNSSWQKFKDHVKVKLSANEKKFRV